jgi:hypothetical protein
MHNLDPEIGKLSNENSKSNTIKRTLNKTNTNSKKRFAEDI